MLLNVLQPEPLCCSGNEPNPGEDVVVIHSVPAKLVTEKIKIFCIFCALA